MQFAIVDEADSVLVDEARTPLILSGVQQQTESDPTQAQPSPWLNITDAADYLRWPKQRLYKLTANGGIPHYKHEARLLFLGNDERKVSSLLHGQR